MDNQRHFTVDFAERRGTFRPLHGANNGPLNWGGLTDLSPFHRELAFPYIRLHDPHWPNPDVVDINAVFPNFDADPSVAANYTFDRTDDYLRAIVENGSKIIYRLGHGIEHTSRKYHTMPPKDYAHWAEIAVGIIRHYNEGWADGFHYGIRHWEIWNEPDLTSGPVTPPSPTWGGTWEDYYRLYCTAAKAIKAHDDRLAVVGPTTTGGGVTSGFLEGFLSYCREQHAPLDFCSWHHYTCRPQEIIALATEVRRLLDKYGYTDTQSLLDEWNYIPPGMDWGVVFNPKNPQEQRRISQQISGPVAAAFDASMLLYMQDCPVDIATYYLADAMPYFSMFDVYGLPLAAFYAFRAFKWLLNTPQRVNAEGNDPGVGVAIGAGLDDAAMQATVLISNEDAPAEDALLSVQNLPWQGTTSVEIYLLDAAHSLERVKQERIGSRAFETRLPFQPGSLYLVKLAPVS